MFRLWFGHLFYCSGVCHGYFAPPLVGIMLLSGYAIKLCYRAVFIAGINTQGKHGHTVVSLSGLHPVGYLPVDGLIGKLSEQLLCCTW